MGYLDFERQAVEPIRHAEGNGPPWNTFWGTAERMRSTLRETLVDNLPKDKDNSTLMEKIDSFLARMDRDLKEGNYVELVFIPGQGTLVKRDGKKLGVTTGKGFADLLWKSYFGGNTCCSSLKSDILKACKAQ